MTKAVTGRKNTAVPAVMDPGSYLSDRVDDQLGYYESAANRTKKTHHRVQTAIILCGVLAPVVINLPKELFPSDLSQQLLVTLLTLSIAALTGLANFRKWGDLWLSFRMTEEILKQEKFLFITGSGAYGDRAKAFPIFVESIERIVSAEHNKFRSLIEDASRPAKAKKG